MLTIASVWLTFPDATLGGSVVEDCDGFYSVYINSRRSWEAQKIAFIHEYNHMANDDFHNGKNIREVEA